MFCNSPGHVELPPTSPFELPASLFSLADAERMQRSVAIRRCSPASGVLAPAVLLAHLRLLLGGEVVDDVELLADLLGVLALDHGRHLGAGEVEKALDVEVIGCQNQLEEHLLLYVDVLGVPLR